MPPSLEPEYSPLPESEDNTAMDCEDQQPQPISLISSKSGFAGQMLQNLISKDLNCQCQQYHTGETIDSRMELALIDCRGLTAKNVTQWLQKHIKHCNAIGLMHMPHTPPFERLIEWPKINGIFYEGSRESIILQGIRRMLTGEMWLPRRLLAGHLESCRATHPLYTNTNLTRRENEILRLMKHGASNATISEDLGLSENTVKSHLYKIYKKIGANNRMDASNWARLNVE